MNKKQRNRKIVTQNKRNRIINKRYVSTIRTLSKLFKLKIQVDKTEINEKDKFKVDLLNIVKNLYSVIDKATKKGILHKNTAARKKSKIGKSYIKVQY
jgi:small subunit ribosomal protein S20